MKKWCKILHSKIAQILKSLARLHKQKCKIDAQKDKELNLRMEFYLFINAQKINIKIKNKTHLKKLETKQKGPYNPGTLKRILKPYKYYEHVIS